jgi:hypothetical protein
VWTVDFVLALAVAACVFALVGVAIDGREGFWKGLGVFAATLLVLWFAHGSDQSDESDLDCRSGPGGAHVCTDPP